MKRIVLISCVKQKRSSRSKAAEMYTSTLFSLGLKFAQMLQPDAIYILSAKYGLITLDEEIDPYDKTLNKMSLTERKAWASDVVNRLELYSNPRHDHFIILAGKNYREYLVPHLGSYEVPLEGLRFGEQLQYLAKKMNDG